MANIICDTRYAAENTTLLLYVLPTQHLSIKSILANPTAAQIRTLTDEKNLLKRDWAAMRGFRRGASENIHDALDSNRCSTQVTTT